MYTQGEAVSLAGKILAGFVELLGRGFFFVAKLFSHVIRFGFTLAGVGIDGYYYLSSIDSRQIKPGVRIKIEEAIMLASKESGNDWGWIDELIVPIKQDLAANNISFINRTADINELIMKDYQVITMARILRKITIETITKRSRTPEFNWFKAKDTKTSENEEKGNSNLEDLVDIIRRRFFKTMIGFRSLVLKCPDDPVTKTELLVAYSVSALKYHKTGNNKYKKQMIEMGNLLEEINRNKKDAVPAAGVQAAAERTDFIN
ncbi:MAG: hypothetical protein LHV68_05990 [Elusimicrobia bacterium]|nr:hypothetical protein [Candidatus Liberimonas magnetica]